MGPRVNAYLEVIEHPLRVVMGTPITSDRGVCFIFSLPLGNGPSRDGPLYASILLA